MLKNYFKIAFRTLWKNHVYSGVNVFGLAVGLATCLLLTLYVADELSYDRYHERADRIYRVVQHADWEGNTLNLAPTSAPFAPALKQDYPEIEQAVRILGEGGSTLRYGETKLKADDMVFADANVFSVFSYPFLFGNPTTALSKPQAIVLTRQLATRLFGDPAAAVGKTVLLENDFPNVVTGVIDNVPANSQLHFSGIRSLPTGFTGSWQSFNLYTYLLLKEGTSPDKLAAKFPAFFKRYLKPEMGNVTYRMELQPLTAIHLHSHLDYENGENGSSQTVAIFSVIAGLILLLAGINYMNLSTARSAIRIREVGIRKAVGSGRGQLAGLFLTETLLLTGLATGLGTGLTYAALPYFSELVNKPLSVWRFGAWHTGLAVAGFALLTAMLSGSYPALFLSGVQPVTALRGQLGMQLKTVVFRKSLVTFQFVITIALLAASGIIYQQLQFSLHKELGFNKDQILTLHLNDKQTRTHVSAIKAQLRQSPFIEDVASAGNTIGVNNLGGGGYFFEIDGKMSPSTRMTKNILIDGDFLRTMEIKLLQGRNVSDNSPADQQTAILVNETLVKDIGWQNPVGKRVRFFGDNGLSEGQVVGVVKDFHIYSLQHKIEPLVLRMAPSPADQDNLYIKIRPDKATDALAFIEKTYRQFEPGGVFNYQFLSQNFAQQYASVEKQGQLLLIFSGLAIFIACLGLFGLAAFTAEQRTREIGVRKVLGASVGSIVTLLSKDFLKLVLIAIVIASPLAWWAMNKWLQDFAYKINIEWRVFALAGLLAVGIALLTVSFQSVKAALVNPVKSLRSE